MHRQSVKYCDKNFIDSQLRNVDRTSAGKRWTEEDKIFALSVFKRSPRAYKYLSAFFQLPSTRTLKTLLSKVPFDTGINKLLLQQLKIKIDDMNILDRYCALVFDEISLDRGIHYLPHKQIIIGCQDLGELGRSNKAANHALVLMIRGLRKSYKQVIGYYFTVGTISASDLKSIIKNAILQLQEIGVTVKATICDQGSTQKKALSELCAENIVDPTSYTFIINNTPIVTIFDVPHLLKCTRNALLRCKIRFRLNKTAKFQYIQQVFDLDQTKNYKTLFKLHSGHFKFQDSFVKMKVNIAARQLSHSIAASIEAFTTNGALPVEALETEFAELVDNLFDSLNGYTKHAKDGKQYRSVLRNGSPHLELWNKLLPEITNWKLIDIKSEKDISTQYQFVKGWVITIRVIYLWKQLESLGFEYLNLRNLNQDPLENLFCVIRQHGVANSNPTCQQFIAALKTIVLNNLVAPVSKFANCEEDNSENLENFRCFLNSNSENVALEETEAFKNIETRTLEWINFDEMNIQDCFVFSYVSGYLIKKLQLPDEHCPNCQNDLFSTYSQHHLFTMFKEHGENDSLTYASDRILTLVENLHNRLYHFLDENLHMSHLESTFKDIFLSNYSSNFCDVHHRDILIIDKAITFLIFKYVKDRKQLQAQTQSPGHYKKMKKFKST